MIILNSKESDELRYKYIKNFVDVSSSYYKEHIEQRQQFSDGLCYTGYLWDCFTKPNVVPEYLLEQILSEKHDLYIMWDIHSSDRIFIPNYWKYPKLNVLHVESWSQDLRKELPEDIYIFDETFSWSAVFTHETCSNSENYCLYLSRSE